MPGHPALREPLRKVFYADSASDAWRLVAHPRLVLARYLQHAVRTDESAKPTLLDHAAKALAAAEEFYRPAFERWRAASPAPSVRMRCQIPAGQRLILGLGNDSVLETGLALHHTYGVPYLPATALKGVAAHFAHQVLGADDPRFRMGTNTTDSGEFASVLFGSTEAGGLIEFSDGWIEPQDLARALVRDVMTPHHGDYYMAKADDDQHPPTDFDDPVPVPFLALARATFHVRLSSRLLQKVAGEDMQRWLDLCADVLAAAVSNFGLGGKTSSGYGRLEATIDR